MRDFWKSSPSWLKPKSLLRTEAPSAAAEEEDLHNLLPPKKLSRRQTWLMGDGFRRSSKSRPSSIAVVDGCSSIFGFGAGLGVDNAAAANVAAAAGGASETGGSNNGRRRRRNNSNRASTYLEFLAPESSSSSHSYGGGVESRGPTNVRYSSFFDHMVSWDRFM